MKKKLAVLCMVLITIAIFAAPWFYYEYIDTALDENSEDYIYNVNVQWTLDEEEKEDMLLNRECLISVENSYPEDENTLKNNINNMYKKIKFLGFEDENSDYFFDDRSDTLLNSEYSSAKKNISFKLVYSSDENIKVCKVGIYMFVDTADGLFKGFAMYDEETYDIYIMYVAVVCQNEYYDIYEVYGYNSIFKAEDITNSSAISDMLKSMSSQEENWEDEKYYIYNDTSIFGMFNDYLKNIQQ